MRFFILWIICIPAFADFLDIKQFYDNPSEAYYKNVEKQFPRPINHLPNKFATRQTIMGESTSKSAPARNDSAENLFPFDQIERNIKQIDKIKEASVSTLPWSDDYWPIYKGVLGNRYADKEFAMLYDWKSAKNYVEANPATTAVTDSLSPGEKYDLLIGGDFKLTKHGWSQGQRYFDSNGSVEKWMGICHGWAPASYMLPRPEQKITVPAANGELINFYPSDLKALGSLLWAEGEYNTYFIGGRCNDQSPAEDENGRVISRDCRDNNASTFFLAITHGLGVKKESFIIDATYDYEVWNQPLVSYNFTYFNVKSEEQTKNLDEALVRKVDFNKDPFAQYRAPKTAFIVGVMMEVTYGVETHPMQREYDNVELDQHNTAYYTFDLELDRQYNVIGGEWYQNQHPDFLWRPARNSEALSYYDYYLMSEPLWNGDQSLNKNVQNLAQKAASQGAPLSHIVKSLIKLSGRK